MDLMYYKIIYIFPFLNTKQSKKVFKKKNKIYFKTGVILTNIQRDWNTKVYFVWANLLEYDLFTTTLILPLDQHELSSNLHLQNCLNSFL